MAASVITGLDYKTLWYSKHNIALAAQTPDDVASKFYQKEGHAVIVGHNFVLLKCYEGPFEFKTFTYTYDKNSKPCAGQTLEDLSENILTMLANPVEPVSRGHKKVRGAKNKEAQNEIEDSLVSKLFSVTMLEKQFGLMANDIAVKGKNANIIIPAKADVNIWRGASMIPDNAQNGLKTHVSYNDDVFDTGNIISFLVNLKNGIAQADTMGLSDRADYRFKASF